MTSGTLIVETSGGTKQAALDDYLDSGTAETAMTSANAWIKALRHADVDGVSMRRRFTYRGDSLWWFTELYLHKTRTIEMLFRTILALEQAIERERPVAIAVAGGDSLVRGIAPQVAKARGVRFDGAGGFDAGGGGLARLHIRARLLTWSALASRLKPRRTPQARTNVPAAFIHRAFWTGDVSDGSAESYIGPVLAALERTAPAINYVGLGPTENFSARRWWRSAAAQRDLPGVVPVEAFASLRALTGSRTVWRQRHALLRALWNSADVRSRAVIRGCDCWPIIREELAGVALLQWPWSARAMDEAGAALDALRPSVALTYAEAGGWGRALMLECRRRGVPSAGLQHGFIYRHWLNYLHEADEMRPDPSNSDDRGFPRPALTLLFDKYAAQHLEHAGGFPPESLAVTGSARLERLVAAAASDKSVAEEPFVLVVTKYREAKGILPALADAAAGLEGVRLVIKTHPAETPDVYASIAAGRSHVRVLPASAPLAPLLRTCRAVVTVNSTVALDAAVLGVPALVIDLPNNLSPFVEAGMLAGADRPDGIGPMLRKVLYDSEFRHQLAGAREGFLERYGMFPLGRAAEQTAAAILQLTRDSH